MKPFQYVLLVLSVFILPGIFPEPIYGQAFRYSGSLQYSTGSYYFTERTGSFYFNNGIGVSVHKISLSVTVPFITQNTPWVFNTGSGIVPTGGPKSSVLSNNSNQGNRKGHKKIDLGTTDTLNYTQANFGDPSLSGSVELFTSNKQATTVSITGGVKLPLANPTIGFGTGQWDCGAGLSWSQRITPKTPFLTTGMF